MPALPSPSESFEQAPEGTHVAVCNAVFDLGTHTDTYQGKDSGPARKLIVRWELADERLADGRRFDVFREYRWSTGAKSNLRKDLEAWRGQAFKESDFGEGGFDIKNIIGKPCLVMIGRTSGDKAKVTGVAAMPKGVAKPALETEPLYLWLTDGEYDADSFDGLSPYWQDKIKTSPEYKALFAEKPKRTNGAGVVHTDNLDDEIPF
jgi:hypothetical protein